MTRKRVRERSKWRRIERIHNGNVALGSRAYFARAKAHHGFSSISGRFGVCQRLGKGLGRLHKPIWSWRRRMDKGTLKIPDNNALYFAGYSALKLFVCHSQFAHCS